VILLNNFIVYFYTIHCLQIYFLINFIIIVNVGIIKISIIHIILTIFSMVDKFILFIIHNIESIMKNIFLVGFICKQCIV